MLFHYSTTITGFQSLFSIRLQILPDRQKPVARHTASGIPLRYGLRDRLVILPEHSFLIPKQGAVKLLLTGEASQHFKLFRYSFCSALMR